MIAIVPLYHTITMSYIQVCTEYYKGTLLNIIAIFDAIQ